MWSLIWLPLAAIATMSVLRHSPLQVMLHVTSTFQTPASGAYSQLVLRTIVAENGVADVVVTLDVDRGGSGDGGRLSECEAIIESLMKGHGIDMADDLVLFEIDHATKWHAQQVAQMMAMPVQSGSTSSRSPIQRGFGTENSTKRTSANLDTHPAMIAGVAGVVIWLIVVAMIVFIRRSARSVA
ncbi:MAG: hypothetical protein ACR2GY_10805 [Phycisphaerales bacterium]